MESSITKEKNSNLLQIAHELLGKCKNEELEIRLLGGMAIYLICPDYQNLLNEHREPFSDLDFIIKKKDVDKLEHLFITWGYEQNQNFKRLFGYQRRIFYAKQNITIEIYLEDLELCQKIIIGDRLLLDYPTLSPTDLFLSKIQRIVLTKKDILDLSVLLLQHKLTELDDGNINVEYISSLCSKKWRWWKTINVNINILLNNKIDFLENRSELDQKLNQLNSLLNFKRKHLRWFLRNLLGTSISWYNQLDS